MKVFVTGGDGLLGSNLVRELLSRKHEVNVLVQPGRNAITLKELPIKISEGDLLDYDSLKKAAGNCESIFHVAANTSIWPSRSEIVNKVNIEGTKNIIQLAKELNVNRLIHVGTANTFAFGSKEKPGVEDTEYKGSKYGLDYMDSKWKAHQLIMNAVDDGLDAVVVNPTFMIGPYDSTPSSGEMVLAVFKEKVPVYAPGGRNFINVEDAATGIANALEMGKTGESYIIGNRNLSYKEAFGLMASVLNVKAPRIGIPKWLLLLYGRIGSSLSKLNGKKPLVSYEMAKISCDGHYFSADKAVHELKLPQSDLSIGIKDCFTWLNENNYIK